MIGSGPASARRRLALVASAIAAMTALPVRQFPYEWLAAFIAPALVLLALRARTGLRDWQCAAIAAGVQIAAIAALAPNLPITPLAALGCTLVPPLAYAAARARAVDAPRGVFLAFCILLVAAILGRPSWQHVLAFLGTAILALAIDVSSTEQERLASWRGRRAPLLQRIALAAQMIGAGIVIFVVAFRALGSLPELHEPPPPATQRPRPESRQAGLSNEFEFDSPAGSPIALRADVLFEADSLDGRPLPADMYLRCGAFEIAGLDEWKRRPTARPPGLNRGRAVGARLEGLPERSVEIGMVVATELAFVPVGTFQVESDEQVLVELDRGTFRFRSPRAGARLVARYQNLHLAELDQLPAPGGDALLQVPAEVERHRGLFEPLLRDPRVARAVTPIDVAEALAAALQDRCEYALREPTGPHRHAILNFLDGDRRGFCMHFASTAALALRMLGVPARVGVGVYGGEDSTEQPTSRSFGSHHAHAWVEIPLEGAGWVVVDPTPPSVRPFLRWPDRSPDPLSEREEGGAAKELAEPGLMAPLGFSFDPLWICAAIAALGLVSFAFGGARPVHERTLDQPPTTDMREARRLMARVLAEMSKQERMRFPREGLESWLERVGREDATLRAAVTAFHDVRFGGHPLDTPRRRALEDAARPVDES